MLDVAAALHLQAKTAPPDRSRLTLSACAYQVERAALILETTIGGLESLGDEFFGASYAFQIKQALVRLRGAPLSSEALPISPSEASAGNPATDEPNPSSLNPSERK